MPYQQDELYAAENSIDQGPAFDSLHAAQIFIDEMRDKYSFWEKSFSHVVRVEVGPGRKNGRAHVGWFEAEKKSGRVEFLTTRPSLQLVIHELSHVLTQARYGNGAHGPWFARCYLELTYLVRGPEVYYALYTAFTTGGIDFNAEGLT